MNALVDRASAVLSGLAGKRGSAAYPAYLKWIGAAALLIASGVIVKASLTHIFVQGNCCADDGYFSLIAKTFVTSFQYGLPISDREVHAFHASIGSGPALILPGALAIALFGPQNWVPGLTAFAMLTVQLAAFAWLLSKVYDKWRVVMFMGVALLAVVATTRFHFYYMVYIGEGPALGFLLLGIACLVLQQTRPHYVYLAGLMFERHNPELALYELYVCRGRYLPSGSGLGEALEIRSVNLSGASGARGWHAGAGAPPSDARTGWGTYTSQGDAGAGRVSLSAAVAPDVREIAVPLITGPVAEGVTFRVLGEDGGEIAVLAAPADATEWRLWRIEMAPATRLRQLRVEADDRGAGWGQWAALGAPRAIGSLRSAQGHRAVSLDELVASAVGGAQHPAQLIEEPGPSGAPTPAVFAHAPMDLSASIGPGARELVVNFGMRARSYASNPGTKGVCFSVDARLASGAVRQIWRRCLTPVEATGDRGMQEAAIALPEGAQRIVFRTRPAVNGDLTWAWAYWAAPRVR